MSARTLTITGSETDQPLVMQRVEFTIRGPGTFTLADAQGKLVQRLVLSGKGSDGMSDRVYPYEVQWLRDGFTLAGACVSEAPRAKGKP